MGVQIHTFFMLALCEGDRCFVLCALHSVGEIRMVPIRWRAGWAPDLVCIMEKRKLFCPYWQLHFLSHAACSLYIELTEVSKFPI